MNKPNFFIIGAPKCGTTALAQYLGEHPNIFISSPKEPQYFSPDLYKHDPDPILESFRCSMEGYLELFECAGKQHLAIGEASPQYLLSDNAIESIYTFNPNAKLILMIRNPVDLVYAFHSQNVNNLEESEEIFEMAWRMNSLRARGEKIPKNMRRPSLLQYDKVGAIGSRSEHVFDIFPREQIHVVVFDDLKASTREVYERAVRFLEVPLDNRADFPVVNQNRSHKSKLLARIIDRQPQSIQILRYFSRNFLGFMGTGILTSLKGLNTTVAPRGVMSPELRRELVAYFSSEVDKLEVLIGRDLSSWRV